MRLFRALPVLSLLFGARASFLDSRQPIPHRLDVRDTPDVCVNSEFDYPGLQLGVQCLCVSTVSSFLQSNPAGIAAVKSSGANGLSTVTTELTSLIISAANFYKCAYPQHSTFACVTGKPCGFACTDGFSPFPANNPTSCVCTAPLVNCNGQCVAAGACPSSQALQASKKRRSWVGSGSCTDMGPGWVACGVLDGGPRAWECVNAARDLESCGGCIYPLTSYSPIGTDCSALPGVADVSCLGGECVVHRCLPGYVPAFDGTSCIRTHQVSQSPSEFIPVKGVPARVYGLEHVPLGRN